MHKLCHNDSKIYIFHENNPLMVSNDKIEDEIMEIKEEIRRMNASTKKTKFCLKKIVNIKAINKNIVSRSAKNLSR